MLEVIKLRRSIRTYVDKEVEEEKLSNCHNKAKHIKNANKCIVAIGYSEEENYFKDKFDESKIHINKFE